MHIETLLSGQTITVYEKEKMFALPLIKKNCNSYVNRPIGWQRNFLILRMMFQNQCGFHMPRERPKCV